MSFKLAPVAWLGIMAVVATGCGFHLRGSAELPEGISTAYLQAPSGVLRSELQLFLKGDDIRLVGRRGDADLILTVDNESFDRRVLSVDAQSGKVGEYEISYTALYSIIQRDGTVLANQERVNLLRDYVFDADAVIGKSREEWVLKREMQRDAAQQILRHLRAALSR